MSGMKKMIFAERKIYEKGKLNKKFWISVDDSDPKEVNEEVYEKLESDEFEKLKNIKSSENKKKIQNTKWRESKDSPSVYTALSELIQIVRTSSDEDACEIMTEFTDALCDEYVEAGYQQAMLDIERIVVTLKKNHKKIL